MKNKKRLFISIVFFSFVILVISFVINETERYADIQEQISHIVKTQDVVPFACYEICQAGKTTFLNLPDFGYQYARKKALESKAWLFNNTLVTEYLDSWMWLSDKKIRKATYQETLISYQDYFNAILNLDSSAKYVFYLLHLLMFIFTSIMPAIGILIIPSLSIVSVKYAFATLVLFFIIFATQKTRSQTFIEGDILTSGGRPTYQLFASSFGKKSTSLLFWTGNDLMLASGPSFNNLSFLTGVTSGQNSKGITISSINAWYIYYTKLFGVSYVTFGLLDQSLSAKDRWFWFKHELIWPLSQTVGLGGRLDGTFMFGEKSVFTGGPTLKLKWDSLTTWIHARLGGAKRFLFLRMEIPIPATN